MLYTFHVTYLVWYFNTIKAVNVNMGHFFYNKFISCLYMFRAPCAHHQEVKIVFYSFWYRHTYRWPSSAQVERGHKFYAASWLITKINILRCTVSKTSRNWFLLSLFYLSVHVLVLACLRITQIEAETCSGNVRAI